MYIFSNWSKDFNAFVTDKGEFWIEVAEKAAGTRRLNFKELLRNKLRFTLGFAHGSYCSIIEVCGLT